MNDKQQKIMNILAEVLKKPVAELEPSMNLRTDLSVDSAQSLELMSEIEDTLEVEIDEVAAAKVQTIEDLFGVSGAND